MGNYIALKIRGKVHHHVDITVTEGGVAKDFTGYTNFVCELKETDDEDGSAIAAVTIALDGAATLGLLDLDITEANTLVIQNGTVHQGVLDIKADDAAGEAQLIAQGDWTLIKGVTA